MLCQIPPGSCLVGMTNRSILVNQIQARGFENCKNKFL